MRGRFVLEAQVLFGKYDEAAALKLVLTCWLLDMEYVLSGHL